MIHMPTTDTGRERGPLSLRPILRRAPGEIGLGRLLTGGALADTGRLPRYAAAFALGAAAIWAPITGYLGTAAPSYTSEMSLILPGSGAGASVTLSDIGQASTFADSAFASNAVSPTVTYKLLLSADRILVAAAARIGQTRAQFGAPRIELVDQTGLIRVAVRDGTPEAARAKGAALIDAFFAELDALRADERDVRESSGADAIAEYRTSIAETRAGIAALQDETGLDSGEQYRTLVAETDRLALRVSELAAALDDEEEAVAQLRATLGVDAERAALTLRLHADTEFAALAEDMSAQASILAGARGQYGPRHPRVVALADNVLAARRAVEIRARQITGLPAEAFADLDLSPVGERGALLADLVQRDAARAGKAAELAAARARHEADLARVAALRAPAARLEDLSRDFQVAEAIFATAMARTKSSRSELYASYPMVQVLEDPSLPTRPSSPRRTLALAAGGVATLMLLTGLGLAWIRSSVVAALTGADRGASATPAGAT
ncbi:hypothetical protein [Roseivivax isoporae]|uniref:Tyrosine kinase G-rich domain-containing protein n=1 Tax=Roseivivax isoporae LMG 25204 TaxID=1449351 RepID=X7F649_9RHOB|nr:hypothetical protein [Roseivivax isoporae]ETX28228.1 hypothetical protein RISW2_08940 [Roseivivax isoporae LMG 25204]